MSWLNVGCGTHRAPEPWVNVDCADNDQVHPDVVVASGQRLPFDDASAERVYLGHVLEHVAWPAVPAFLAEVRRVLDGEVLVTGPDVYRTVHRWSDGLEPWDLVASVMEHAAPAGADNGWPEALHHWNCHEARVVDLLERAGFADVAPTTDLSGWPVVQWSDWQCAVKARA